MNHLFSISLRLLLHDLNISFEESPLYDKNPHFTSFSLFDPSKRWDKSHLIVGMLSDVLQTAKTHPGTCFLCIRDRFADDEETTHTNKNLLVLTTNKKIHTVFNELLAIFTRYKDWDTNMRLSITANEGIQPLIDLTENMIGNHIDIMDATFKLMGYTRHIDLDDPITRDLLLHGYHSDETITRLLDLRRFEEYERENDIIVSDDFKLCDYVTLKRVFHHGGKPVMYVVMHCNHREADKSLLDLFQMFLQYVENYADMDNLHPSAFAASTQYLRSLLDRSIKNMDEAISRASYATIPFQQDYQLFAIAFEDHFNTPLDRLAVNINQSLPFSYVLVYNRRIVILHNRRENDQSAASVPGILEKLLQRYPCIIASSNPFSNLWEARPALEQAGCAIDYGSHVLHSDFDHKDAAVRYFPFEESFLTLLVTKSCNSSPELFKNSFLFRAIQKLQKYDEEHDSSFLKTLEIHLDCGKKTTETSERLHMHRNTVLYHIEKIEQILGISLNDPETSIKLYLGIKTLQTNMIELTQQ